MVCSCAHGYILHDNGQSCMAIGEAVGPWALAEGATRLQENGGETWGVCVCIEQGACVLHEYMHICVGTMSAYTHNTGCMCVT